MQTLSYGFEKPERPDKGVAYFPAMERNVQRMNDHDHDGTNSAKLSSAESVEAVTQTVLAAGWVDQGGGTYRQLVNCPTDIELGTSAVSLFIVGGDDDGSPVNLSIKHVSSTSYYVYSNDPAIGLKAVYTT